MGNKFSVILMDAPWRYQDRTCRGAAENHYSTMTLDELKRLKVPQIAADNCALFMWATWPLLREALELINAYGFTYKTSAFIWVKTYHRAEVHQYRLLPEDQLDKFWGNGRWTRKNTEPCLLAIKGKPKRVGKDVHEVIYAPATKHSEKPAEARRRIVQLMGDVPRIELFARGEMARLEGWATYGNECVCDVKL